MKFEGPVDYYPPEESEDEEELRHHKFEIKVNGEVVSAAEVHYHSRPIPFYQVTTLYTEYEHSGKGYASAIMNKIESFLIERKKPGILLDTIMTDTPEVAGMYERRGWKRIGALRHRVFNLPEHIDPHIFDGYWLRGIDMSEE